MTNIDLASIYGKIEPLQCLQNMTLYYQYILGSIKHLAEVKESGDRTFELARMSFEQVRDSRRYINSDLEHFGLEFYLQRVEWARRCHEEIIGRAPTDQVRLDHIKDARRNPSRHPCRMRDGFVHILCPPKRKSKKKTKADTKKPATEYTYEHYLGQTLHIFVAIHSHLTSINRALGDLYQYVTQAPFSTFTPLGKSEIRHLTRELNRIMRGLLIATHLQPQAEWQNDLINYLTSCRADCQRFIESIPDYYQTHRMRQVVFKIDPLARGTMIDPYDTETPHLFPVSCLPWSAGMYSDFLSAYQSIAVHVLAVLDWALRLYSLWYFVPRRYLRLVSPSRG